MRWINKFNGPYATTDTPGLSVKDFNDLVEVLDVRRVEDMDDLQKLSVYMHYYIDWLMQPPLIITNSFPIDMIPYDLMRIFKQTGVIFYESNRESSSGTPITVVEPCSFDLFKEVRMEHIINEDCAVSRLEEWYSKFKNEIKLA